MTSRSPPPWSRWVAPAGATHRLHGNTISLSSYTTSGDTPSLDDPEKSVMVSI